MEKRLETYMKDVEGYLKPLPTSERASILTDVKDAMMGMKLTAQMDEDAIIARLGTPKELAQAYLRDVIHEKKGSPTAKIPALIAFYSMAGLGGVMLLPALSIIGITFQFCGVVVPIAGVINIVAYFFGHRLPFSVVQLGGYAMHPIPALFVCAVVGALLFFLGKKAWEAMLLYVDKVKAEKRKLVS